MLDCAETKHLIFIFLIMMGVCLGHQGLAGIECHDCEVVERSPEPFHGRVSTVNHDGDSLFQGIPFSFKVMRYHSLVLNETIATKFHIIARTDDHLIMAIRHKHKPFVGVQFHPESFLSEFGDKMVANFLFQ